MSDRSSHSSPVTDRDLAGLVRQGSRVGWLDGLRGIAALQVILFHYGSAFLPAIGFTEPTLAHYSWEQMFIRTPLGFLFDGSTAVYLFFIMSGVALTYAFSARPYDILPAIMRRLIRLGVPMAASILLAAALFSLLPDAQEGTLQQTHSVWFGQTAPRDVSPMAITHQIAFEGLLAGYRAASLLPGWVDEWIGLVPKNQGLNPALWTLHVEFYGSLLVILLVALRALGNRTLYVLTCVVLGVGHVATLSPLSLFIAGHLAAYWQQPMKGRRWQSVAGSVCLFSGIVLCTADRVGALAILTRGLPLIRTVLPDDWEILQKMIGACLIFGGLALLPVLQRLLERPQMRWLGKISFSLYLVHFPLLFTFVAACFTLLDSTLPYGASIVLASVGGIASSVAIAACFERWIDRPSIRLSRMVGGARRRVVTPVPAVEAA